MGRTGAGKSSIINALFRLAELDGGAIRIDGERIAALHIAKLRASMALIPQLPVLFNGTLRANLSPTGEYSEAQIWHALDSAHLRGAQHLATFQPLNISQTLHPGSKRLQLHSVQGC